jgi:hypothetical protein
MTVHLRGTSAPTRRSQSNSFPAAPATAATPCPCLKTTDSSLPAPSLFSVTHHDCTKAAKIRRLCSRGFLRPALLSVKSSCGAAGLVGIHGAERATVGQLSAFYGRSEDPAQRRNFVGFIMRAARPAAGGFAHTLITTGFRPPRGFHAACSPSCALCDRIATTL